MAGIKSLAGDTLIYGLSTIVARMLNYLMVPYLTRVMTTGEYGVVTDLYSLIPFALVVLTMGLESGYFRFAGRAADGAEKNRMFVSLMAVTAIAAGVFLLLVGCFQDSLAGTMGYEGQRWLVVSTGIIIAFDVTSALPFARLREQWRRIRYAEIRLVSVVVNLAMCLVFYSLMGKTDAVWVLWANVVASFAALVMLLPTMRGIHGGVDWGVVKIVMVYSLPLLISGVAGTAGEFIDRQMIKWLMPAGEALGALGVYGATAKLAVIMVLFTQMYRLAAEPFFLAKFAKGDFERQSRLAMWGYLAVAAVIFAGVMIFKPLILLILGEDFRGGEHLLPVLLAANALAGVVLNLSFWYKRQGRTWLAIAITGTGLVVALVLNLVLVPKMGYDGAAWARLFCEIAMVVVSLILMKIYAGKDYQPVGE